MTLTERTAYRPTGTRVEEFKVQDRRGRWIGAKVYTFEAEYTAIEGNSGCMMPPGHYHGANVQATRNGENYGACQSSHYAATIEERDAWIAKRLADSRKRAAKLGAEA